MKSVRPKIRMRSAMVSGLGSHVQLFSTELALKAIRQQEAATTETAGTSPSRTSPQLDLKTTSVLQPQAAPGKPQARSKPTISLAAPKQDCEISTGIASAEFMGKLKTFLADLSSDPTTASQGKAMLVAMTSSTLKVFDPLEGIVISARDTDTAETHEIQQDEISPMGWSQFLKERVTREKGAAYAKNEDGSFIDAVSGENALFGPVGSNYYYFTWP